MPEILAGRGETNAYESVFLLFANGGHVTLDGLRRHFVENPDGLPGQQRRIHYDQRPVRAYKLRKRF